jgi:hypothetical protein
MFKVDTSKSLGRENPFILKWPIINEFMAIFSMFKFYFIFLVWVGESFLHDIKDMLGFL